ncbi:MAG: hypothetical protein OSA99_21400 [Acidimicrobiales bacterium]|nr:hypothetical protein [Acidimicrobiales bacterium]
MNDSELVSAVMALMPSGTRERWGWHDATVVGRAGSVVALDAGGLPEPMYCGHISLDVDTRTVEFLAIDARAPHEQRWLFEPDAGWWSEVGSHPLLAVV